jgi:hypothetical protein
MSKKLEKKNTSVLRPSRIRHLDMFLAQKFGSLSMAKISVLEKLHAQSKTNAPSSRPKEKPSHSASCTYRLSKDLPISPKTPFQHIQILPGIETPSFCCRRWDQVKRFREELNAFSDPFLRSDPKDNTTSQREPFASHTRVSCARQVARLALSEKSPLKQTPMK